MNRIAKILCVAESLKTATEEWYKLPKSSNFNDVFWAVYELEFKYSQLKSKPEKWEGSLQRYENTLKKMREKLLQAIQMAAKKLYPVYENWLDNHAITNPKKWGEKRVQQILDYEETIYVLGIIESSYNYDSSNPNFKKEVRETISKNLNRIPKFKEILEEIGKEEKENRLEDDEETSKEDLDYLDDPSNVWDFIFDVFELEFISNLNIPEETIIKILNLIAEKVFFPVWYAKWEKEGINETRKRIETRFKEIKNLMSGSVSDPQEAAGKLNSALQEAHQTGAMMDYIEEEYEESYGFLDDLSTLNTDKWEEELEKIGMKAANINR